MRQQTSSVQWVSKQDSRLTTLSPSSDLATSSKRLSQSRKPSPPPNMQQASAQRLSYNVTYVYKPFLRKRDEREPTLSTVLRAMGVHLAPADHAQPGRQHVASPAAANPPPRPAQPTHQHHPPPAATDPPPQPVLAPTAANPARSTPPQHRANEWRDLSGDATTILTESFGHPPQCILASARNLARREHLTEADLIPKYAKRGTVRPNIYDIDFIAALDDLACEATEIALHAPRQGPRAIQLTPPLLGHLNSAFCSVQGRNGWCTHVVAIIRIPHTYPARFRLYDNDSAERRSGTFASVHADYIIQKAQNPYLTTERDSTAPSPAPSHPHLWAPPAGKGWVGWGQGAAQGTQLARLGREYEHATHVRYGARANRTGCHQGGAGRHAASLRAGMHLSTLLVPRCLNRDSAV